jgi:hypothetical protein
LTYIPTARHLVKKADLISKDTQHPQANTRKNIAEIVLGLTVGCKKFCALTEFTAGKIFSKETAVF